MQCPKCSTGRLHDTQLVALSSAFHGSDSEVPLGESGGWSCYACGYYKPYPIVPKPIKTPPSGQIMTNGNYRSESQIVAKMRCEDYFEKFKMVFKDGLITGRTFKAVWLDLKAENTDLPSRSWLRGRYLKWVKGIEA